MASFTPCPLYPIRKSFWYRYTGKFDAEQLLESKEGMFHGVTYHIVVFHATKTLNLNHFYSSLFLCFQVHESGFFRFPLPCT
jgi:hypothetical protein